jgi:hypothetical protein
MPTATYQERVLNAPDVCSNCLRRTRVERQQRPDLGRSDVSVRESEWSRNRQETTVEYAPAETASESKGVFCQCGVEGSYERVWADRDVDRDHFKQLVQRLIATIRAKGIALDAEALAATALAHYDDRHHAPVGPLPESPTIDECLARGLAAGIRRRAAPSADTPTAD